MAFYSSNGNKLFYRSSGEGEPLLMIMGLGQPSKAWNDSLIEQLAKQYQVIVYDHLGTGQSDKPRSGYSMSTFANDAINLLDHLQIKKAHVVGISMGGMIGQTLAIEYPERLQSLTLGCTTMGGPDAVPIPKKALYMLTDTKIKTAEEAVKANWSLLYEQTYIANNQQLLMHLLQQVCEIPTPGHAFKGHLEATATLQAYQYLFKIKVPVLVITGEEDHLIPSDNSKLLADRIEGSELIIIPNQGHGFFLSAQREFLEYLESFLTKHRLAG